MSYSQPPLIFFFFFFNDTATTEIYTLSLHDALPIFYWLEAFRSKGREELEAAALATFQARMEQYGLRGKCVLYRTQSKEPSPEPPEEYLNMTRGEAEAIFEIGRASCRERV